MCICVVTALPPQQDSSSHHPDQHADHLDDTHKGGDPAEPTRHGAGAA
jgi:hypothetical protein